MTVQVRDPSHGKSKAALQKALNEGARYVIFVEPRPGMDWEFNGLSVAPGTSFPVVMDPKTRMRFAKVTRRQDGTFKVE